MSQVRRKKQKEHRRKREETRKCGSTLEEGVKLAFTFQMMAKVTLSSLILYNRVWNRVVNIELHPG